MIPGALASDGTAVKTGLDFDPHEKVIILLAYKEDAAYVSTHHHPDPQEMMENVVTSAYLTS